MCWLWRGPCDCRRSIQSVEWRRKGHRLSRLLTSRLQWRIIGLRSGFAQLDFLSVRVGKFVFKCCTCEIVRKKPAPFKKNKNLSWAVGGWRDFDKLYVVIRTPPSLLPSVTGGCCWWWIAARACIWHLPYMTGANPFSFCVSLHKLHIPGYWPKRAMGFDNVSHVSEFICPLSALTTAY